jgi:bifunctional non-homologous end joining protein LigD
MSKTIDKSAEWEVEAGGHTVRITHPDNVLFPDVGVTKRNVVEYYLKVEDRIMPFLMGRPLVLHRMPDGVAKEGFYQKRAPESRPDWVKTAVLPSPTNEGPIEYVVADNIATVLWLVNLGAFEVNPWLALAKKPEDPTHMVADLDPMDGDFSEACRAALYVKEALEERGLKPSAKTSGKTGMHVSAKTKPGMGYPEVRTFLEEVGRELDKRYPEVFALEEKIKQRQGQIYFDYNQNGYGSTIASAWSVRPTPTATISMPLTWAEVEQVPDPKAFTLRSVMEKG